MGESHADGRTNEDEGQSDDEGQDVATQRLVVLAVPFGKVGQAGVDVVFTQSLETRTHFSKTPSPDSSTQFCIHGCVTLSVDGGWSSPGRLWVH